MHVNIYTYMYMKIKSYLHHKGSERTPLDDLGYVGVDAASERARAATDGQPLEIDLRKRNNIGLAATTTTLHILR